MENILRWIGFLPLAILAGGLLYYSWMMTIIEYLFGDLWWFEITNIPEGMKMIIETIALAISAYAYLKVGIAVCPNERVANVSLSILAIVVISVSLGILVMSPPVHWDIWNYVVYGIQTVLLFGEFGYFLYKGEERVKSLAD